MPALTGKKTLNILLAVSAVLLMAVAAAGVSLASPKPSADPQSIVPEYVGSETCLGCHSDNYAAWSQTGHANMVVQINRPSDIPNLELATEAQRAELLEADYMVAGQRFIAKDRATMDYKYLNVQYNPVTHAYVDYKGGSSWNASCAGCHAVGVNMETRVPAEMGIGCESCHGPGKAHVLGKGDRSKITIDYSAEACGQCHTGGSMPDGTRWPVGYKPGMKVSDTGFRVPEVDRAAGPPDPATHWRQYPALLSSGHLNAVASLESSGHASANCYTCHSAEAIALKEKGAPLDQTHFSDGVSCAACHDPHSNQLYAQLKAEPDKLCVGCHTGSINAETGAKPGSAIHHPHKELLAGYGAPGVPKTAGAHTSPDISCVDCHMTEGNHLFAVLEPKMVEGSTRTDTCVSCHTGSSPEARQGYIDMWQTVTKNKVEAVNVLLQEAAFKVQATPGIAAELKAKYDTALTDISMVEADGSWGAHNFEYAMKALVVAEKNLKEFMAAP